MVNILIDLITEENLSSSMIQKILLEAKVDTCHMILAQKSEFEQYKNFGTCFFREDVAQGKTEYKKEDQKGELPVDENVLRYMEPYFIEIMNQQRRFEEYHDFHISATYENHYTILMRNLAFWNNMLEKNQITHFFVTSIPHEGFDSIIYHLCKMKGIAVCMVYGTTIPFREYVLTDYLHPENRLWDEYIKLQGIYEGTDIQDIPLEGKTKDFFERWASLEPEKMKPWNMRVNPLKRRFSVRFGETNIWRKWIAIFGTLYEKRQYKFSLSFVEDNFRNISSYAKAVPQVYKQWSYSRPILKRTIKLNKFYDSLAEYPAEGERYIYFPLHYQPEASSNPLGGGIYTDQILLVNLLAQSIPADMKIYVKNHPEQLAPLRSKAYYLDLKASEKVKLIKLEYSTFDLMKNAFAVASITGTACWECQFFNIPAILFGYSHKNLAPLSYPVRTFEECKAAIESIQNHSKKATLKDLKLMTKAIHNISYGLEEKAERLPQIVIDFVLGKNVG